MTYWWSRQWGERLLQISSSNTENASSGKKRWVKVVYLLHLNAFVPSCLHICVWGCVELLKTIWVNISLFARRLTGLLIQKCDFIPKCVCILSQSYWPTLRIKSWQNKHRYTDIAMLWSYDCYFSSNLLYYFISHFLKVHSITLLSCICNFLMCYNERKSQSPKRN